MLFSNKQMKCSQYAPLGIFDQYRIPHHVDWVKKEANPPVKNQCGSLYCWAFAACTAVEAIVKIRTGELKILSVQELIDNAHSSGDGTGRPKNAFEYIIVY